MIGQTLKKRKRQQRFNKREKGWGWNSMHACIPHPSWVTACYSLWWNCKDSGSNSNKSSPHVLGKIDHSSLHRETRWWYFLVQACDWDSTNCSQSHLLKNLKNWEPSQAHLLRNLKNLMSLRRFLRWWDWEHVVEAMRHWNRTRMVWSELYSHRERERERKRIYAKWKSLWGTLAGSTLGFVFTTFRTRSTTSRLSRYVPGA